jgi:hypothetical protein
MIFGKHIVIILVISICSIVQPKANCRVQLIQLLNNNCLVHMENMMTRINAGNCSGIDR